MFRHPYLKPFFNAYKNKLISSHICKIQWNFLKTCYVNCVIPKSLLPSTLRFIDNDPFNTLSERILKHSLDTVKYDIDNKFYKVRSLFRVFKDNYSFYFPYNFDMFKMCIDFCHDIARNEVDKDYILNFKNFLKKVHGFLLVIWTMLLIFLILIFRQNSYVFLVME